MDKELERYYEDRFEMMNMPGWKALIEDISQIIVATNDINRISSQEQLWITKGELTILTWLTHIQAVSKETFENLQKADLAQES